MPKMTDLHNHALFGLDDGPPDLVETMAMIEISYGEGVRDICFTPHDSGRYTYTEEDKAAAFSATVAACQAQFPDLTLHLGSEVMAPQGGPSEWQRLTPAPLGEGQALLLECMPDIAFRDMSNALITCRSRGFVPVLAHAERYACLLRQPKRVEELRRMQVYIQINASTLLHGLFQNPMQAFATKLLRADLVDVVASDAHRAKTRSPCLAAAYQMVEKWYGAARAMRLFEQIPQQLLTMKNRKECL